MDYDFNNNNHFLKPLDSRDFNNCSMSFDINNTKQEYFSYQKLEDKMDISQKKDCFNCSELKQALDYDLLNDLD